MTKPATLASARDYGVSDAPPVLLTDEQVIDFVIRGYILVQPTAGPAIHQAVCRELDANGTISVDLQNDPLGLELLDKAPSLSRVFNDPVVHGATLSLLGPDYFVFGRFCHATYPKTGAAHWHQDDVNVRTYQVRRLMFLYYPQDTTVDMGPTYVVPGTHLANTPSDRMQTYGNIRTQLPLAVPAGTMAITHYDIWHSASHNRSDKMRYMVKYYVDRTHEPVKANWDHHPETAIPLAMQRMHHETTVCWNSDFYKERHLRWRMYSHLLGSSTPIVWNQWPHIRPALSRPYNTVQPGELQGYLGMPMY